MYTGRSKLLMGLAAILMVASLALVPLAVSEDSSAEHIDGTSFNINSDSDIIVVNASEAKTIDVYLTLTVNEPRIVFVSGTVDYDKTDVSLDKNSLLFNSATTQVLKVTVDADKLAHQGEYLLTLNFDIRNPDDNTYHVVANYDYTIDLKSSLSANEHYNKFMGIWENDFTGVLGNAWFPAVVTCVVWLIIGLFIMIIAIPVVLTLIMKKDDPNRDAMRKTLRNFSFVIIILNGIGKALRVLGVSEAIIDSVNTIFYLCYIVVGAMVVWRFYIMVVNYVVKVLGVRDFIPGGSKSDFESFRPLLIYIGEIVITVLALGSIMSLLGFNMTAIITSAGIVSLGITMGAQSVLSQFFSGLVILATRPFKAGDLITLNGGSVTYRVKRVNVMFTEFENWDNTDISIIPNSALTGGIVKNITRETLKSKIHVFIEVGYGTDLKYAREAMMEVANAHPRVIKDGSVSKPSTRVTDFLDSNIQLRLSVYVDDFNDSGVIGGELRQALYDKFNEKNISIDYTQIVVHAAPDTKDD